MQAKLREIGGFSLIELAIVMVLVAFLLTSAARLALVAAKQQHLRETYRQLGDIQSALKGYIARYGHLPCPDNDRTIDPAGYGIEDRADGVCVSAEGWLPFVSIGGAGRYDAWGNRFRYRVLNELAQTPNLSPSAFLEVCESVAAQACDRAIAAEVAAVVISHGVNGFGARNSADRFLSLPNGHPHELENSNGRNADDTYDSVDANARLFVSHEPRNGSGVGGEYDDLVAWVPYSVMLSTLLDR